MRIRRVLSPESGLIWTMTLSKLLRWRREEDDHNIIQIHSVHCDWQYSTKYSTIHTECEDYSTQYYQSHRTLLWIWIMLWCSYGENNWAQMHFNSGKPFTHSSIKDLSIQSHSLSRHNYVQIYTARSGKHGRDNYTPWSIILCNKTHSVLVLIKQSQGEIECPWSLQREVCCDALNFEDSKFDNYLWDFVSQHLLSETCIL
jgi:hypothetical protein